MRTVKIDRDFGNYFAGFADGEGSFTIVQTRTHDSVRKWRCQFSISLRADDRHILDEFVRRLGIGVVHGPYARGAQGSETSSNRKPQVMYFVRNLDDVPVLVEILRKCPLRAKKAKDFEIWSEAVEYWLERDWEALAAAKIRLEAGRKYG